MLTYQEIVTQKKQLEREYQIRNLFSCLLIGYAAYTACDTFLSNQHPMITLIAGAFILTSAFCLAVVIVKLRQLQFTRKDEKSLMESIGQGILQARRDGDYTLLNQLLDSSFSCHTILKMSELPEGSYNYQELSKWVKLKDAMKYFREHKITVKDFYNLDKMNNYLVSVYPEFIEALRKSDQSKA